jgi:hypothetical protein
MVAILLLPQLRFTELFVIGLVHRFRDWYSGVAIKMGRRQGATKEHI